MLKKIWNNGQTFHRDTCKTLFFIKKTLATQVRDGDGVKQPVSCGLFLLVQVQSEPRVRQPEGGEVVQAAAGSPGSQGTRG